MGVRPGIPYLLVNSKNPGECPSADIVLINNT